MQMLAKFTWEGFWPYHPQPRTVTSDLKLSPCNVNGTTLTGKGSVECLFYLKLNQPSWNGL